MLEQPRLAASVGSAVPHVRAVGRARQAFHGPRRQMRLYGSSTILADRTTTALDETNPVSGGVFDALCAMADRAAEAQRALAKSTTDVKNGLLAAIADALDARADEIAAANALDMSQAFDEGMDAGKLDRL